MFKNEVPTGTLQDWSTLGKSPKFDAYLHEALADETRIFLRMNFQRWFALT